MRKLLKVHMNLWLRRNLKVFWFRQWIVCMCIISIYGCITRWRTQVWLLWVLSLLPWEATISKAPLMLYSAYFLESHVTCAGMCRDISLEVTWLPGKKTNASMSVHYMYCTPCKGRQRNPLPEGVLVYESGYSFYHAHCYKYQRVLETQEIKYYSWQWT